MSDQDNRMELSPEDLEKVNGGGNVEGGKCRYCGCTSLTCTINYIRKDDHITMAPRISCDNPKCPTNQKDNPFYGRHPMSLPTLVMPSGDIAYQ